MRIFETFAPVSLFFHVRDKYQPAFIGHDQGGKMLAATAERRPNGTSVASITTQLRSVVLALAMYVVRTIVSSNFFLGILHIEFNGAQMWIYYLENKIILLMLL